MGRAPCCDKENVKKGPWSPEEDAKLKEYIRKHGTVLKRCGKSCRLRWLNYLRPNLKHGEFSDDEDRIICSLFTSIGSRWSIIAAQLPGRTDNDIKNYWNTKLKKKLMGKLSPPSQTSYFTGYENPISIPSVFLNSSSNCSSNASQIPLVQAQESFVGPLFGGEASSSSDGSCNNQVIREREHDNYGVANAESLGFHSYFFDGYSEKSNGYGETDPEDYSSLEEIKELISTNNICNSLNFYG